LNYLYPDQVLYIHDQVVAVSGGSLGLRDRSILESAVFRPQSSFGGLDLYPDLFTKAAVLCHSLILNHPFVDANKRAAYETLRVFLQINGRDISAKDGDKFDMLLAVSEKKMTVDQIAAWLEAHTKPLR